MRRERRDHRPIHHHRRLDGGGGNPPTMTDVGMDELLAALGYNVRSSDMSEVAQKLEQLEMVIGNAQEGGISQLSSGTVHYNPSDIATWVDSMLTELNPVSPSLTITNVTTTTGAKNPIWISKTEASSSAINAEETTNPPQPGSPLEEHFHNDDDDDEGIEGVVYGRREKKRLKFSQAPLTAESVSEVRPMVVVDSEEKGIRLVHALIACAEAVQEDNVKMAEALLKQIGDLAGSLTGSAMKKVATFFAEALACRIYKLGFPADDSFSDLLQMHFYEACPYLKFAHFTANQAILEAFSGCSHVHVIDFSMKQGMQWPALMQALAVQSRDGCNPPAFRLTGIGPPQPDGSDPLQQVGLKLAQFAETINMEFEYRGFVASSLADIEAYMLDIRPSDVEAVAVNSIFELHRVLSQPPDDIDRVLSLIRDVQPRIVTVVEQEANHNERVFLDRFTEALHYYSSLFDSLEACAAESQDRAMAEVYLGREICNVVAAEGGERVERHETLARWRARMSAAGFTTAHLGSNAFKQASMLLSLFTGSDGYRVEENNGCLTLGWHTRPLIATSAWKLPPPSVSSSQ